MSKKKKYYIISALLFVGIYLLDPFFRILFELGILHHDIGGFFDSSITPQWELETLFMLGFLVFLFMGLFAEGGNLPGATTFRIESTRVKIGLICIFVSVCVFFFFSLNASLSLGVFIFGLILTIYGLMARH